MCLPSTAATKERPTENQRSNIMSNACRTTSAREKSRQVMPTTIAARRLKRGQRSQSLQVAKLVSTSGFVLQPSTSGRRPPASGLRPRLPASALRQVSLRRKSRCCMFCWKHNMLYMHKSEKVQEKQDNPTKASHRPIKDKQGLKKKGSKGTHRLKSQGAKGQKGSKGPKSHRQGKTTRDRVKSKMQRPQNPRKWAQRPQS